MCTDTRIRKTYVADDEWEELRKKCEDGAFVLSMDLEDQLPKHVICRYIDIVPDDAATIPEAYVMIPHRNRDRLSSQCVLLPEDPKDIIEIPARKLVKELDPDKFTQKMCTIEDLFDLNCAAVFYPTLADALGITFPRGIGPHYQFIYEGFDATLVRCGKDGDGQNPSLRLIMKAYLR